MRRKVRIILAAICLLAGTVVFAACGGAHSESWRMASGHSTRRLGNGFAVTVGSARSGQVNRTYTLNEAELASIHVHSHMGSGEIVLVISQNGEEDGTEIVVNVSGHFNSIIDASHLNPGRIRFSLRLDEVRNTDTTITW